jgi:transposase InsO family protein
VPFGRDAMSAKREFVELARGAEGKGQMRELCRRFGISRTTGYEWLRRFRESGVGGLEERSRKPLESPTRTPEEMERRVLELRDTTHWGARKIAKRLRVLGVENAPPRTTVNNVLKRHGRITAEESAKHHAWHRFEHHEPNDLWQMDFKGWFMTGSERCNPLTVIDDHSRFALCLRACADQTTATVQAALTDVFDRYGLPWRMTMDNGSPWGDDADSKLTKLVVWLIRLGVAVSHSRPFHPQTQGKDERLHRSLDDELLNYVCFRNLTSAQLAFDVWRDRYNFERPHESLAMLTPIERYTPSARAMPAILTPIEYPSTDLVRKVDIVGKISFRGRSIRVSRACAGLPVALRPTNNPSLTAVFFCHQKLFEFEV